MGLAVSGRASEDVRLAPAMWAFIQMSEKKASHSIDPGESRETLGSGSCALRGVLRSGGD